MKRYPIIILILVVALAATACVKLGGKPIDKKFYRIAPTRTAEPAAAPNDAVLKVRRMKISDFYNTRELVYQMKDGRIESDFYNMLFVPPSNMLTTELRRWLAASGRFTHIVEPGSMVVPTLTLEGVVGAMYGDYTTDTPTAVIEMQFFLVDENTTNNDIVFSRDYRQRIPLTQPEPHELVQALTTGVEAIFTQLENDLSTVQYN